MNAFAIVITELVWPFKAAIDGYPLNKVKFIFNGRDARKHKVPVINLDPRNV